MSESSSKNVDDVLMKRDHNFPVSRIDSVNELSHDVIQYLCQHDSEALSRLKILIANKQVFIWGDNDYPRVVVELRHLRVGMYVQFLLNGYLGDISVLSPGEYKRIRAAGVKLVWLNLIRIESHTGDSLHEADDQDEYEPELYSVALLARNPAALC